MNQINIRRSGPVGFNLEKATRDVQIITNGRRGLRVVQLRARMSGTIGGGTFTIRKGSNLILYN